MCRTAVIDRGDDHTVAGAHTQRRGQFAGQVLQCETQRARLRVTGIKQTFNDDLRECGRDGKPYSYETANLIWIVEGGVDSNDVTLEIHQRAARVAVIDGCVG